MPILLRGATTGADAEVDSNSKAVRVSARPLDFGGQGSFQIVSKSGTMAAGLSGDSPIYSFRNAHASLIVVVRRITLAAWSLGTGFTAGIGRFELYIGRSWSGADTGGTTDTITTNNGKLRTSMASIGALAEIRHSATATLSAGTRTLDTQPQSELTVAVTNATNTVFCPTSDLLRRDPFEYPLIISPSEGFVIQATVPATGTWTWAIKTQWDEVASFAP